jgi:hypothetical protein
MARPAATPAGSRIAGFGMTVTTAFIKDGKSGEVPLGTSQKNPDGTPFLISKQVTQPSTR